MNNNNLVSLLTQLASKHYILRHNKPKSESDSTLRNSFFYCNEQSAAYLCAGASFPCLVLLDYRGNLEYGSAVDDKMILRFEVRDQVKDKESFAEMEQVKDRCKKIVFDIAAWMHRSFEDNPEGPISAFDLNTVQYSFVGPVNDNQYGCYVTFHIEDEAFNPYTIDIDEIFSDEPITYVMETQLTTDIVAGNWSLPIPQGKLVQSIVLVPQNNTTLKIGTSAGGEELLPETSLTAGQAEVITLNRYFATAGSLHFTTNATINYKIYIL